MSDDKIYVFHTDDGKCYRIGADDMQEATQKFNVHFPKGKILYVSLVVWEDFGDEE